MKQIKFDGKVLPVYSSIEEAAQYYVYGEALLAVNEQDPLLPFPEETRVRRNTRVFSITIDGYSYNFNMNAISRDNLDSWLENHWIADGLLKEATAILMEDDFGFLLIRCTRSRILSYQRPDVQNTKNKHDARVNHTVQAANQSVSIDGYKFDLISEGDAFVSVDAEKYRNYYNQQEDDVDVDNAFELDYPDAFAMVEEKPFDAKEFFDTLLDIGVEEPDDYGTRYNISTEYWYINAYKVDDLTAEAIKKLFNNYTNYGTCVVATYDAEGKLYLIEYTQD